MVLKYVIDTNIYSAFNRGLPDLRKVVNPQNQIFIPLIVIAELRAGFSYGRKKQINESLLVDFLNQPNVTILWLTEETTKQYGRVYTHLRRAGKPIGTNDIWIAALCLENNLPLLTLDFHFKHIKGLKLVALQT